MTARDVAAGSSVTSWNELYERDRNGWSRGSLLVAMDDRTSLLFPDEFHQMKQEIIPHGHGQLGVFR